MYGDTLWWIIGAWTGGCPEKQIKLIIVMKPTELTRRLSLVPLTVGFTPRSETNRRVDWGPRISRSVSFLTLLVGAIVTALLAGPAGAATWSSGFINPLTGRAGGSISVAAEGLFLDPAYNNGVASRSDWREHVGEDYPIVNGSRIYPITGGTVLGVYGSGKDTALAVDHGSFVGIYGHISPSVTRVGGTVTVGQSIGTVVDYGRTGASGDHLHFGILEKVGEAAKTALNKGWGRRPYGTSRTQILSEGWRDPIPFLNSRGGSSSGNPGSDPEGNTRSTAKPLTLNATTSATMGTGDVDYFVFTVTTSGEFDIRSIGDLDLIGRLEDSSGRSLAEDDDTGVGENFRLRRTVTAGKYYLRITGYRDRQSGGYGLEAGFQASSTGSSGGSDTSGAELVFMNGSRALPSNSLLLLGTARLNETKKLSVRLKNTGAQTANITSISLSSRDLRPAGSAPSTIRVGQTATLSVNLVPSARGQQTWGIRVILSNGEAFTVWFRADVQ